MAMKETRLMKIESYRFGEIVILESKGIRIEALPTEPAIQRFNKLASQLGHEAVAFAVHITC